MRFDVFLVGLSLSLLLLGCGQWKKPVDPARLEVPTSCPDFSGIYWYPGADEEPQACRLMKHNDVLPINRLMLPVFETSDLGGGNVSVILPSKVEIEQDGCRALRFGAGESWLKPASEWPRGADLLDTRVFESRWREWTLELVPAVRGTDVEWTDDSLYFETRFIAEGFGAGWGVERFRFRLELTEGDSILVEYRHEQGRKGESFFGSRCELVRVE